MFTHIIMYLLIRKVSKIRKYKFSQKKIVNEIYVHLIIQFVHRMETRKRIGLCGWDSNFNKVLETVEVVSDLWLTLNLEQHKHLKYDNRYYL